MRYLVLLICILFSSVLSAQITIVRSNYETGFADGVQLLSYNDTVSGSFLFNVGRTGGPNVYDFTSVPFSVPDTAVGVAVSNYPFLSARFPSDAIGIKFNFSPVGDQYVLFRFTDSAFFEVGNATVIADTQQYLHWAPELFHHPFPMTHNNSWSYSGTEQETLYINGNVSFTEMRTLDDVKTVDGYGTLLLPGLTLQCLRVIQKNISPQANDYKAFQFFTREGLFLEIQTHEPELDTGTIIVDNIFFIRPVNLIPVSVVEILPSQFLLSQNFPNPFNSMTEIRYQISKVSHVSLTVYDILGREVATLVNATMEAGEHRVVWDASSVTSGIYFYRLREGTFINTKKLVLMK